MKKFSTLGMMAVLLSPMMAHAAGSIPGYKSLFTLERTQNANQVVYEANLANTANPIHAYWIMLAQDGHTEELTSMERSRAYGTQVLSQSPTEVKFVIKSFTSRPMTIRLDANTHAPYAVMDLEAGEKIIVDFYLTLTHSLFPGVSKVDVSYKDAADGPVLRESFDPND